MPEVLFDGTHVQVLHFPGGSGFSLITFDVMHARANGRMAFASKLAVKNGFDLYGIVPKHPCWYPAVEMEPVADLIRARLDRPAIAYGASMGGYGALRWGAAAGAQAALAFSPQASIDPAVVGPGDRRYVRYFDAALHRDGMAISAEDLALQSWAIFDPQLGLDAAQVALLPEMTGLHRVRIGYTGHKTATAIASSATAKAVFAAALAGDTGAIRAALLTNKKQAVIYHATLAAACLGRGHATWASRICSAALEVHGSDPELLFVSARAMTDLGAAEHAVPILRRLLERTPLVTKYRLELVRALQRAGDAKGAMTELARTVDMTGNFPLQWKLINTLLSEGQHELARQMAETAADRWPEKQAILDKVLRAA